VIAFRPRGQIEVLELAAILGIGLIFILHQATTPPSETLPAPQSQTLGGIVEGIFDGDVAGKKYAAGVVPV